MRIYQSAGQRVLHYVDLKRHNNNFVGNKAHLKYLMDINRAGQHPEYAQMFSVCRQVLKITTQKETESLKHLKRLEPKQHRLRRALLLRRPC